MFSISYTWCKTASLSCYTTSEELAVIQFATVSAVIGWNRENVAVIGGVHKDMTLRFRLIFLIHSLMSVFMSTLHLITPALYYK